MFRTVPMQNRSVSRRSVLGVLAAGGATAAAVTLTGRPQPVSAAQPLPDVARVILPFEMSVRQGPAAGLEMRGALGLRVLSSGAINDGVFVPIVNGAEAGTPIPVEGQVTGRAINLYMDLPVGPAFGIGVASEDIRGAQDVFNTESFDFRRDFQMGGPLVGPGVGNSGDWIIFIPVALAVVAGIAVSVAIANAILPPN